MVFGRVIKGLIERDELIWRNIKRWMSYRYYRFEHYRLESIRTKMWQYREITKEEMLKKQSESSSDQKVQVEKEYEWKWVYVVKQAAPKVYASRFKQKLQEQAQKNSSQPK